MTRESIFSRRKFVQTAAAAAAVAAIPAHAADPADRKALQADLEKHHEENVRRLQDWIKKPAIAAENRAMKEGAQYMVELARGAGLSNAAVVPTDGHPGVFATLDAGAARTVGIYFMYDVKQVDSSEWSTPPFDAALVDRPNVGKILVGRGATNQKGPESTFLAALHSFRNTGKKLPVNLVFVAEGEEEIGSPHFTQVIQKPEVLAALKKCSDVYLPMFCQSLGGGVQINLGAKGIIELELVSSGEHSGKGPKLDVHSSEEARIDSPAWRLIQALNSLVGPDGHTPAIDGFFDKVRPLTAEQKTLIREAAKRQNEAAVKKALGVERWVHGVDFLEAMELLVSKPTINIEGLVSGYTGPGGKTVLPHRAVAKIDMRLVPDMTAQGALASLKAHLAKRGFTDIEVNMSGGYDPTSTAADSGIIRGAQSVYKKAGLDPVLWPRLAGSWPGYMFTSDPLRLPAGHFGLGHGAGAHAPNEYCIIESKIPLVKGFDGAVASQIDFLYELGAT